MKDDCVYTTDIRLDKDGYPRMKHNKRVWGLHRLIYTFVQGEIPQGMVIGHSCNNKGCINPHHLYLTTPEQNSSDAARDGLYRTGFVNEKTRIAHEDWKTILRLYHDDGLSQETIGKMYGVSQGRISEICRKYKLLFTGDKK